MHTKTIKLQAEHPNNSATLLKFAVTLDLKRHRKVGRFIEYVKRICELDGQEYQLTIDGFVVPKNDRTKGLQESHVYRLRIQGRRNRQLPVESEEEQKRKEKNNDKARKEGNSKREAKAIKMARKKKQEVSSSSESEDESLSSSSSSSSSSSDSSVSAEKPLKKVVKKREVEADEQTPKKVVKAAKKPIVCLPPKKQAERPKKSIIEQVPPPQQESSSSSSSSSDSQEELPKVKQSKNEPLIAAKPANQAKSTANATVHQKTAKSAINIQVKKNTVIQSSSSQSEPSDYQPKKKPEVPTVNPVDKLKTQGKIPPALRNKFVKKNFDQHKQNQWLAVQKQSLKKWQEDNKYVCQNNNKIRFKIVQLDEEKFIPIKSGWITADVKSIDPETGIVTLSKVEQEGKPYRESLQIPQHNMDELQINRLLASKQQISCFQPQPKENTAQPQNQAKPQIQPFQPASGKSSLEKYICGQVNYYFTDKNYNFDLFMQMHANRHPQKYLNLRTMLNFGKIKKFLYDEDKLFEFLREDEKYQQRTYEVDFERRLIRKKGIKIDPVQEKEKEPVEGEWGPQHQESEKRE